jgi:hypothetical protein
MTREQITEGLELLVLQLANGESHLPKGWTPHEWAYLKGVASHAILQVRDRLVVVAAQ